MSPAPLGWGAEALWLATEPLLAAATPPQPGFSIEIAPRLDSTNSELMRRARAGRTEPVLLLAESQTAGRGRLGRAWIGQPQRAADAAETLAEPGGTIGVQPGDAPRHLPALTFSLGLLLPRADWSGLSLAVGTALVHALRPLLPPDVAADLGLKWPNDLWWRGCKLAGILIESSGGGERQGCGLQPRYAVIGIGINLDAPQLPATAQLPGSAPPLGLRALWPAASAPAVLAAVAPVLVQAVLRFVAGGFGGFLPEYEAVDLLRDQAITLDPPQQGHAQGVALGPDASGALRVRTPTGVLAVASGEVRVRPV